MSDANHVPTDSKTERDIRTNAILWVLVWTLLLNLASSLGKIIVGHFTGLLNVMADGMHSLTDAFVNVVGLVSIKLSGRPPDEKHPYGYGKYETIATLIIGSITFVLFVEILQLAVKKLLNPAAIEVHPVVYAVMVGSLILNGITILYEGRMGRKLKSEFLVADCRETASDVCVSVGIIIALVLIARGWQWLDGLVTLGIALVVLRNSVTIFREAARILSDEAVLDPQEVIQAVETHPQVRWAHAVRSRGKPDVAVYVDLHIGVDPATSVEKAHDVISHEVKQLLSERFPGIKCVLTHIEPDNESARRRENSVFRYRDY